MTTQFSRRAVLASFLAGFAPNPLRFAAMAQSDPTISIDDLLVPTSGISGSFESILTLARERAQSEYRQPTRRLSGLFSDLDYDAYRAIRTQSRQLQANTPSVMFDPLPPGMVFTDPVTLSVIDGAETFDVRFDHNVFSFDPAYFDESRVAEARAQASDETLGYSGFRLRAPLNRPDRLDEFLVFQGGSYFRAVARGMTYGLSARGLAVKTASPEGEEFPGSPISGWRFPTPIPKPWWCGRCWIRHPAPRPLSSRSHRGKPRSWKRAAGFSRVRPSTRSASRR